MNEKEKAIIRQFLKDHSHIIGNRCCNDWGFPKDWTQEERLEFTRAYHEWNGDPECFDPDHLFLSDCAVAEFLAHRLT